MKSAFLAFPAMLAICAAAAAITSACGSSSGEDLFGTVGTGGTASGGSAGNPAGGSAGTAQGGSAGTSQGGAPGEGGAAGQGGAGQGGEAGAAGAPGCNPIGHDEDGDGHDDACDNCPSWPNPGQGDADGDGLGEECEAPEDPGMLSKVQYFEPFVKPPMPQWDISQKYKLEADALLGDDDPCNYGCGANAMWNQPLNGTYSIETVFDSSAGTGWAGLIIGEKQQASWIGCLVQFKESQHELQIWKLDPGQQNVDMVGTAALAEPSNVSPSTLRRLRVFVRDASLICRFENSLGDDAVLKATASDPARLQGRGGVRVYETLSHFRSLSVLR